MVGTVFCDRNTEFPKVDEGSIDLNTMNSKQQNLTTNSFTSKELGTHLDCTAIKE